MKMIRGVIDIKSHWENAYKTKATKELGWYEDSPEQSLALIKKCNLSKNARLLHVGAGATTLVDEMIKMGYSNMIASDISESSLSKIQNRLGSKSKQIHWISDDLTTPTELFNISGVDLWHDRAVLHFFTEDKDQKAYFDLLHKLVRPGGFVIIAVFNTDGAKVCSGLPVFRYNKEMLEERIGNDFRCLESFDFTFIMPGGDERPYIYTLFRRTR